MDPLRLPHLRGRDSDQGPYVLSASLHAAGFSTTQVSLQPPPWELLTTISPAPRANRVSPPIIATWLPALLITNGRRSIRRGTRLSPRTVGWEDSAIGSWAMKCSGRRRTTAIARLRSGSLA